MKAESLWNRFRAWLASDLIRQAVDEQVACNLNRVKSALQIQFRTDDEIQEGLKSSESIEALGRIIARRRHHDLRLADRLDGALTVEEGGTYKSVSLSSGDLSVFPHLHSYIPFEELRNVRNSDEGERKISE